MKNILGILVSVFLLISGGFATEISPAKYARLVAKGEKIALKLCEPAKLPSVKDNTPIATVIGAIDTSKACSALSKRRKEALAYFLLAGGVTAHEHTENYVHVPHGAKCPVCGMFVSKYPKWAAEIDLNGKHHYFDGVKDMMKYYIFDGDFPYDRTKITAILVTDYYTLEALSAKEAYYVIGSKQYGPMGNELIPFKTEKEAKDFIADHGGDRIVRFGEITGKMVMGLDGIDYEN